MNDPLDLNIVECDIFDNPRYDAIFSRGVVVTRDLDDLKQSATLETFSEPIEHLEHLLQNQPTQAQLITAAKPSFSEYVESPQFEVFELVSKFNFEFPSRTSNRTNIGSFDIAIPVLRSNQVSQANRCLTLYIHRVVEYLSESYFKDSDHYIDVPQSVAMIEHMATNYIDSQHRPNPIARQFIQAVLLEQIAISSDYVLLSHLSVIKCISDDLNTYQPVTYNDTYNDRSQSMIQPSTIRGTSTIQYGLNRFLIDHLVTYIFSNNPCSRLESKIALLSSTKELVRSDLISKPGEVLLSTFSEYLMSPSDIASVIFCKPGSDNRRCPCCTATIPPGSTICHSNCDVFQWLKTNLPIMVSSDSIVTEPYRIVAKPIADRIRRLYDIKSRIQSHYMVHRSEAKRTLYTIKDNNSLSFKFLTHDPHYQGFQPTRRTN